MTGTPEVSTRPLRIALVAPNRFPIREPYAGGLESFCASLVEALRKRGHQVDMFAARGSTGNDPSFELPPVDWGDQLHCATDTGYPEGAREEEDTAYRELARHLASRGYDVVHNNSLNPGLFPTHDNDPALPLVTTFHTPMLPVVQHAIIQAGHRAGRFTAVSSITAREWTTATGVSVIPNGVDTDLWTPGPGGAHALWFGRMVPEKAPHLAMDACARAGLPLVLAGRNGDRRYFDAMIAPRLERGQAKFVGELSHESLRTLVGTSAVCVVTPEWDEPFGLVAFEAMSTGTPVAAFQRGGLGELLATSPAVLAVPGDVNDLARAILDARSRDRHRVAQWVRQHHSLEHTARTYEEIFQKVAHR